MHSTSVSTRCKKLRVTSQGQPYHSSTPLGMKTSMLAVDKTRDMEDAWPTAAPIPTPIWPAVSPMPAAPGLGVLR